MRILIIHAGALGDCVLMLPAIVALAERFPDAWIELAGLASPHGLLERRSPVHRVVSIEQIGLYRAFTGELPEDLAAYLRGFDLIISWFGHCDAAYRRALESLRYGDAVPHLLIASSRPPEDGCEHAADYLLRTLAPLEIAACERTPRLTLLEEDHEAAKHLLRAFGIETSDEALHLIAIHPGSGGRHKCWPIVRFAQLIRALDRPDRTFLIIEGPADHDVVERLSQQCAEGRRGRLIRVTNAPLPHLAAVLARCRLFIGNDSGVTHLAAAVGTPVIALFIATDPARWGPRGHAHILRGDPSVEDVRALAERMLESADLTRRPRSRTDPIRSSCPQ
jgi:ADP-heptose:LPS heptosyltransferase